MYPTCFLDNDAAFDLSLNMFIKHNIENAKNFDVC